MASRTSLLLLLGANLLIPVAILIFANGFFPYKPFLPGLAEYQSLSYGDTRPIPESPFDKVVFMVVDALRRFGIYAIYWLMLTRYSDFVYVESSGFSFTQR